MKRPDLRLAGLLRGAAAGLWLLLAGPVGASEPELFGFGARSSALGGTGAADGEGYDATYTNPAGLVGPTRRRLTVGYVLGRYHLKLDGASHPVEPTNGIVIGADLPIPFGGVLRDRVALGLAFYFPTNVVTRAQSPYPDEARLALLDERTQVVSLLVAGGIRLHPRVQIGGGVLALAALVGEIDIAPDASGRITTVSQEQLVTSFAPIAGLRVRALDWLSVGATLRGESKSRYDLQIKSQLGRLLPLELPTIRIAGVAQYDPLQIALEGAARFRLVKVALGATWKHWSAFPLPAENAAPGTPPQPSPGYHDTVVPRIGVEVAGGWPFLRLIGRAGYFFEWSPAPIAAPTLIDASRHVLTCGLGVEWVTRLTSLQLDAFGQWHHIADDPRAGARVAGDFGVFGLTLGVDL